MSHVPPPQMQAIYLNPELFQPMHIKLESPEAVAQRRSVEMAARRQAMAEGDAQGTESAHSNEQDKLEAAKSEADAWAAARLRPRQRWPGWSRLASPQSDT